MAMVRDLTTFTRKFVSFIVAKPIVVVAAITLVSMLLIQPAIHFQDNMSADVEQYLPEGDPATDILKEVRQNWSTDIVIVYVETPNAKDPSSKVNITERAVLLEMSHVEGDDDYGKADGALDWDKNDRGRNDDVVFVLSIAMVIKELNSTYPRFYEAVEKQTGLPLSQDDQISHEQGRYAIPTQQRINAIVNQSASSLKKMVVDTNDDGIWDTAVIVIGITHTVDQKEFMKRVDESIEAVKKIHPVPITTMTKTGLVVVLNDVTDRIYSDLLKMIPLSFILVISILILFHRTWKIVFIAGPPVLLSLIWTFGILRLSDVTLTPMVVAAAPILIGLSVDDALHVTNRINEFRHEYGIVDSIIMAYKTTGRAIFLTTVTTIIGFTTLLISPIIPMRIVGVTLFIGMTAAFILTVVLVPPLTLITKYFKKEMGMWQIVGGFPVKKRFHILAVAAVLAILSIYNLSAMSTDIRGDEAAPEDIVSLQKIKEYTEEFKAGQTGIIIVRGNPEAGEPVKDIHLLDAVNRTEVDVDAVENTSALSVVDFLKSMKFNTSNMPDPVATFLHSLGVPNYEVSAWEIIHSPMLNDDQRRQLIEIFYDTLSNETRSMLMNDDYSKTLIYTEMPYVNIQHTKKIVREVNEAIDRHEDEVPGGSISHLTGGAPVSIAINDGILGTQYRTIFLSGILVFLTLIVAFMLPGFAFSSLKRGLKIAIIAMVPLMMVVLLQPLLMIGAGSHTNIFTAMLGTIIIGIGIDFSVHMSERIQQEGETFAGIARATRGTGQSMVEASSTTVMGVAAGIIVSWNSFAGLRNFFIIISALLVYSLLAGLLVLPAIYAVIAASRRYGGLNLRSLGVPGHAGKESTLNSEEGRPEKGVRGRRGRVVPETGPVEEKVMEAEHIDWEDAEYPDEEGE